MAQRKTPFRQKRSARTRQGADEATANAIASILRQFGGTFPNLSGPELVQRNPEILKRLAKFFVQQCFRNTVLEDYHAGIGLG